MVVEIKRNKLNKRDNTGNTSEFLSLKDINLIISLFVNKLPIFCLL